MRRPGAPPAFAFESPVWWDPKARGVIMKPRTFLPCMLLLDGPTVLVVGEHDVVCRGEAARAALGWPEQFELPVCDLRLDADPFRLFFVRPHPKVPDVETSTVAAFGRVLAADGRGPLDLARMSAQRLSTHANLHSAGKRMEHFRDLMRAAAPDPPLGG